MSGAPVLGRWLLAAAASASLVAVGISHAAAQSRAPATIAPGSTVEVESQAGANPSVSGDGRFVVFSGPAPRRRGRTTTVLLRDRSNGAEVELTRPQPGCTHRQQHVPCHQR